LHGLGFIFRLFFDKQHKYQLQAGEILTLYNTKPEKMYCIFFRLLSVAPVKATISPIRAFSVIEPKVDISGSQ